MPELPEVETTVRTLRPDLLGRTIVGVRGIDYPPLVVPLPPEDFAQRVVGRQILAVGRRAKFILLHLDNDEILSVHLRMSGRLYITASTEPLAPHVHAVLDLNDGRAVHMRVPRKFGRMRLLTAAEYASLDARLGPEPLAASFTVDELASRLQARRARLKALLLDQHFLAGLGNIYTDETLFRAGLHPLRPADDLDPEEISRLYHAIRQILTEAITAEGTTLSDSGYLFGEEQPGQFAERLCVYGRAGEPCPTCGTPIVRQIIAGRSSHFCPVCQS